MSGQGGLFLRRNDSLFITHVRLAAVISLSQKWVVWDFRIRIFQICSRDCLYVGPGNGCNEHLQIFRVALGWPRNCFRCKKTGVKCYGQGAQLIISWPVGYVAKRVRPSWLFLWLHEFIYSTCTARCSQSEPAVSHTRDFRRRLCPTRLRICLYIYISLFARWQHTTTTENIQPNTHIHTSKHAHTNTYTHS